MKLNRKGFMMAEVVVVSVIICTVLVTLYTALVRINNAYDTRNRYYDIDTLYFTEEINYSLISSGLINKLITNGNSVKVTLEGQGIDLNEISSFYNSNNKGETKIYFSLYKKNDVKKLANLTGLNETFKDYITYANDHFDYNEDYEYMLITEMCKTNDDCYYYGLRVR